ncbi:vWA domain-containing protein [Tateyamaria sp. SN6-1]|uniref:vWA domain-containing protein n=1 Tax=Tateyamaria sp. SN6-1 TaxID=3092148 RepID=UPI0039F63566
MKPVALLLALTLSVQTAMAECASDAMVVFDGSASMSEVGFDTGDATRIEEARLAMARVMPQVEAFRRIGLLTYGPGGDTACSGASLRFLPRADAADLMIAELDAMRPSGLTPLADAVEQAAEALDFRNERAVVVLVTDGNETCGGRPCAVSERLAASARDLIVHVIGFRVSRDFFAWNNPEQTYGEDTVAKCFADRTGGLFVTTETVDDLVAALQRTLGCPVIG